MATWKYTDIIIDGQPMKAQAPLIVSASRSTDIPAFYADWFFHRLEKGYSAWTNPFVNHQYSVPTIYQRVSRTCILNKVLIF